MDGLLVGGRSQAFMDGSSVGVDGCNLGGRVVIGPRRDGWILVRGGGSCGYVSR